MDVFDLAATAHAIEAEKPTVLWLETPSNPLLQIADLAALAALAHALGARARCGQHLRFADHPGVTQVHYPGLSSHGIATRQMEGFGTVDSAAAVLFGQAGVRGDPPVRTRRRWEQWNHSSSTRPP